ncbi:DUF6701 domain-containing protein [Ectothiorhodospira variabilis]|uniref:DUF6701 domain-containing protein n=1 Tax=Ectothiorhodospira variabilis TaxID=505694 RepID=UPI001EFA7DDF|nr:DUF6701 domain-containing protein [Ectothiorhodospira variabilis]MCG5495757.1 hypothetical protein [Ectothiorhodospira variabilis]MCG5505216.1 hypothetical protein [Ectothiorhodospira variabilis]MCG5508347.1 hypothetical protein [Ectothiorhodospira variabilis]
MIRIHPASVLRSGIVILAAASAPFSHASSGVKYEISGADIISIGQMDVDCFKDDLASKYIYYGDTLTISFDLILKDYDIEDERPEVTTKSFEFDISPHDPANKCEVVVSEWDNGDSRTIEVQFTIGRNDTPIAPQPLRISVQSINGAEPTNPILVGDGDAIKVRYGRLRLDNALGSTNQLIARWRTEYWDSKLGSGKGGWQPNQDDACTFFELTQVLYRTASNGAGSPIDNGNAPIISPESGTQFNRLTEPDEWNLDLSKGPGLMGFERIGTDRAWLEITFDKDVESVFGPIDWARLSFGLHAGDENRVFTLEVP